MSVQVLYQPCTHHVYFIIMVSFHNVCASTVSTLHSQHIFHHYGASLQCLCKYCVNLALITYISSLWCLSAMFVQVLCQPCTHHVYFIIMVSLRNVCASTVSTLHSSRIFHHYGASLRCLCKYCVNLKLITYISSLWCLSAMSVCARDQMPTLKLDSTMMWPPAMSALAVDCASPPPLPPHSKLASRVGEKYTLPCTWVCMRVCACVCACVNACACTSMCVHVCVCT